MPKHEPKYELTDETILFKGHTLHRIRALRDFYSLCFEVKVGELGGFVGSEDNLSHEGVCWISDQAKVFEDARVSRHAWVNWNAWVKGRAAVGGRAWVSGKVRVGGNASLAGTAWVGGNTRVRGDATIEGTALIATRVGRSIYITTGHFTSGAFGAQSQIDAYLASLETKKQTHAQA